MSGDGSKLTPEQIADAMRRSRERAEAPVAAPPAPVEKDESDPNARTAPTRDATGKKVCNHCQQLVNTYIAGREGKAYYDIHDLHPDRPNDGKCPGIQMKVVEEPPRPADAAAQADATPRPEPHPLLSLMPRGDGKRATVAWKALLVRLHGHGASEEQLERLLRWCGIEKKEAKRFAHSARFRFQLRDDELAAAGEYISPAMWKVAAEYCGLQPAADFKSYRGAEIDKIGTPREIVVGRFVERSLVLVVGESGVMKTFLMTSLGLSLASSQKQWLGARITGPRRVVYAIPEGFGFFKFRIQAWMQEHRVGQIPDSFDVTKEPLRLLDDDRVDAFIRHYRPFAPEVCIFDTWHRHGGPEMDEKEMRHAISNVDRVREELGMAAFFVGHTPKDGKLTPRGHGSIDAAADTVALCKALDEQRTLIDVRLEQRDLEESRFAFQWKVIDLDGTINPDTGEPRTSCVVELAPQRQAERAARGADKEMKADEKLRDGMRAFLRQNPGAQIGDVSDELRISRTRVWAEADRACGAGELRREEERKGAIKIVRLWVVKGEME